MKRFALATFLAFALACATGCSRPLPDSTPEGAVHLWLDRLEAAAEEPQRMADVFAMLGPEARANLAARADRASRIQGRRVQPEEMLAEGRIGLRFRPQHLRAHVTGDTAVVDVEGNDPSELAQVKCAREGASWKIEPALPALEPVHAR